MLEIDPRVRPSKLTWWLEAIVVFVAYQAFDFARTLITGDPGAAGRNARAIVRLERWTSTYHELALQRWVLPHHLAVEGLDIYYGTVHFVVPPLVLIWLWRRVPERYRRWRNTLIISSLLALVVFALYPLTPPRLMPASFRFTDTMRTIGGLGPLDSGNFKDHNPYAAMPSLHVAWSTWCAFALATTAPRRWVKVAVFAYPLTTLFVVVGTANHWLLDAAGAWLVLALGWVLAGIVPGAREPGGQAMMEP